MKTLDTGKDKIQKICDKLRVQTLEPAQQEAERIIDEAKSQAAEIIAAGKKEAQSLVEGGRQQIEQERNVFKSSLSQAVKQSIASLKQEIENRLFNEQLHIQLEKPMSDPQVIGKILEALVEAIEKDGISTDLAAVLPKTVTKENLAKFLTEGVFKKLQKHPITIGEFEGGVQLRLQDKKITLDMTQKSIEELMAEYVRKDFHKLLFAENE